MRERIKKAILLTLIFTICGFLNYNPQMLFKTNYQHWGWNFSLLTTLLIILIMKFRDPISWQEKLGINFHKKDILGFLISTVLILLVSYYLVDYVTRYSGYSFKPQLFYYKEYFSPNYPLHAVLGTYFYYFPETFNEEMLIGAVLLMGFERRFRKFNRTAIAILVAMIFSLMHQSLYKWSPVQPGILLTTLTLLTLFFVGILRNILILKTRKIVYSWAIHLSFNLVFFAGFYVNESTNKFASEPERFNIVFGNLPMVIVTAFLAITSLIWLNFNGLRKNR